MHSSYNLIYNLISRNHRCRMRKKYDTVRLGIDFTFDFSLIRINYLCNQIAVKYRVSRIFQMPVKSGIICFYRKQVRFINHTGNIAAVVVIF